MKNMIDNEITVLISSDKAILKFPKCALEVSAFIGKNGLTSNKQEGDDCTPIGKFDLGLLLGTHDKIFNKNYDYTKISSDMYWVDDSNSIYYNKLVDVTKVEKDWNSAEHLIDYPIQYEYLVEIKSNPSINTCCGFGALISAIHASRWSRSAWEESPWKFTILA